MSSRPASPGTMKDKEGKIAKYRAYDYMHAYIQLPYHLCRALATCGWMADLLCWLREDVCRTFFPPSFSLDDYRRGSRFIN